MGIIGKEFRFQYAAFFGAFVLFGISMTVVGATLPGILAEFSWNYLQVGIVLASGSIVYFVSSYIAGKAIDRLGAKTAVAFGLFVNAVALALFASVPDVAINAVLWALAGFGQGFIEVGINWSVLRMEKDASGRAMSVMHGAFAIGAVAGPMVTGFLLASSIHWGISFRGIAMLLFLLGLVTMLMPGKGLRAIPRHEHVSRTAELSAEPVYWLGFITLFLYVGAEMGVTNWSAEYYVKVLGASPVTGAFMVSVFWMGLLGGRLGLPLVYRGNRRDIALVGLGATMSISIASLAIAGFLGGGAISLAYVASCLAGFGCSCVYPFVITLVADAFPKGKGEAIGFAATGGGVGAFAFPYAMAAISNSFGLKVGFLAYAAVAVLTALSCRFLVKFERLKRNDMIPEQ